MDSITNDTIIFGLLAFILAGVFYTQKHKRLQSFYNLVPAVLLCYLLPAILVYLKVVDPSESKLYFVASRYLLPAALVLMTLSVDLKAVLRLGPKDKEYGLAINTASASLKFLACSLKSLSLLLNPDS